MSTAFIDITASYNENVSDNVKYISIDDIAQRLLKDSKKMNDKSLFEIITNRCSPYFDIETIPYDQPTLILSIKDAIISTLQKYSTVKIPKRMAKRVKQSNLTSSYIITENKASLSHDGLSYHMIFPNLLTTQSKLKAFTYVFLRDYPQYKPYIDQSVYSKNRLFRLPYQAGINPPTIPRGRDINSIHVIKYVHFLPSLTSDYVVDKHNSKLFRSILKACIISNYSCKPAKNLTFKFDNETIAYIKQQQPKAISSTTMFIKDESVKQVYKARKQLSVYTDEDLYNKCVVINELTTNEEYKNKVNEFIDYYTNNNKSFNDFRLTLEQIHGILAIMETKI